MARKLHTKLSRSMYAKRKGIVEPVFGQIKYARGFRQFLLRGLENVAQEWKLICATHNLLKLFRHTRIPPARSIAYAACSRRGGKEMKSGGGSRNQARSFSKTFSRLPAEPRCWRSSPTDF